MKLKNLLFTVLLGAVSISFLNATVVRYSVLKSKKTPQQIIIYGDIHRNVGGPDRYRALDLSQLNSLLDKLGKFSGSVSDIKIFFEGGAATQEELDTIYSENGGLLIRMKKASFQDKIWQKFATDTDNRAFLNDWVKILAYRRAHYQIPLNELKSFISPESSFFYKGYQAIEGFKEALKENLPKDFELLIKEMIVEVQESFADIYDASVRLSEKLFNLQGINKFLDDYMFGDTGWHLAEACLEISTLYHIAKNLNTNKIAFFAGELHAENLEKQLQELDYKLVSKTPLIVNGKNFHTYDHAQSVLNLDGEILCNKTTPLADSGFDLMFA